MKVIEWTLKGVKGMKGLKEVKGTMQHGAMVQWCNGAMVLHLI